MIPIPYRRCRKCRIKTRATHVFPAFSVREYLFRSTAVNTKCPACGDENLETRWNIWLLSYYWMMLWSPFWRRQGNRLERGAGCSFPLRCHLKWYSVLWRVNR
jgi:hypothetical protein